MTDAMHTRAVPCGIATLLALACLAGDARAQARVVFSVDFRGGTLAQPDSAGGTSITDADALRAPGAGPAFGPLPPPAITFTGGNLGLNLYTACLGHLPGTPCGIEVDALSFGNDRRFDNTIPPNMPGRARLFFSVDRLATGTNTGVAPNVFSEGALNGNEAAADVFTPWATLLGPIPPGPPGPNVGVFDGNGLPGVSGKLYRGLGLREPGAAGPPFDNLDALTIAPLPTGTGAAVYFSLDATFTDPATGQPNSGSALQQGVPPSAVLKRLLSGGPITIYANPSQLGLSPDGDDIDALILWDNGDGVYQPSLAPYDWLTGTTDMLLFSVRRGSTLIGQQDSQFNAPIEPGDVLLPPATPGARPRIFLAAEALGLATQRTGHTLFGDDLDGMATREEPYEDCNGNGIDDAVDIGVGSSSDSNNNGIPDECEQTYTRYCYCPSPLGPCGNHDAAAGCRNSTGSGGLLSGAGTTSVTTDDLMLGATGLPGGSTGLYFMGPNATQAAFGDGLRCISGPTYRLGIVGASGGGNSAFGPGIVSQSCMISPGACIGVGSTMNFQLWYRNAAAFCTSDTFNLTNGLSVVFTP